MVNDGFVKLGSLCSICPGVNGKRTHFPSHIWSINSLESTICLKEKLKKRVWIIKRTDWGLLGFGWLVFSYCEEVGLYEWKCFKITKVATCHSDPETVSPTPSHFPATLFFFMSASPTAYATENANRKVKSIRL